MSFGRSIRARLIVGAMIVLGAFMAAAGFALQRAHEDSVRAAHFARLQSTIYVLLAGAEVDASGALVMPGGFPEPRLSLPGSGLYANVLNVTRGEQWQSASTVGVAPPFERSAAVGQWRYETAGGPAGEFLVVAYGVKWSRPAADAPLVLSVAEHKAGFDREVHAFRRTLWTWLGAAGVLLLLSQTLLLEWALSPLQRVAREISRVENGEQALVEGRYPTEISALTGNLNTLIEQERTRQTRYKEALSFLAHSLKTPLAVLRTALGEPAQLPAAVAQQVARMDDIVQHQLSRAAASGSARFVPPLPLAPVANRIRDSLAKIYAGKGLDISVGCPADLSWRIDEGDAFELLGNLMDNAAKWAAHRVVVRVWLEPGRLRIWIDDDGPGFTDTQAVLRIHVRGDERVPGHGVGLAVVNELVASHGGAMNLGKSDLGGARVDVTLPRA